MHLSRVFYGEKLFWPPASIPRACTFWKSWLAWLRLQLHTAGAALVIYSFPWTPPTQQMKEDGIVLMNVLPFGLCRSLFMDMYCGFSAGRGTSTGSCGGLRTCRTCWFTLCKMSTSAAANEKVLSLSCVPFEASVMSEEAKLKLFAPSNYFECNNFDNIWQF